MKVAKSPQRGAIRTFAYHSRSLHETHKREIIEREREIIEREKEIIGREIIEREIIGREREREREREK